MVSATTTKKFWERVEDLTNPGTIDSQVLAHRRAHQQLYRLLPATYFVIDSKNSLVISFSEYDCSVVIKGRLGRSKPMDKMIRKIPPKNSACRQLTEPAAGALSLQSLFRSWICLYSVAVMSSSLILIVAKLSNFRIERSFCLCAALQLHVICS